MIATATRTAPAIAIAIGIGIGIGTGTAAGTDSGTGTGTRSGGCGGVAQHGGEVGVADAGRRRPERADQRGAQRVHAGLTRAV